MVTYIKELQEGLPTGVVRYNFWDLLMREENKSGVFLRYIKSFLVYSDGAKVTTVLLFNELDEFIGAGTAIKSPTDKFNQEAGFRKAAARALRSVTVHAKKENGKRVRLPVK